jgi:hypothetical protein
MSNPEETAGQNLKLICIPYGNDEELKIVFEGTCIQIREYLRNFEQDSSKSKRCNFIAIEGNVIPATLWAPIDSLVYEPLERKAN